MAGLDIGNMTGDSPGSMGLLGDLGGGSIGGASEDMPFDNAHPVFGRRLKALQDLLENTYGLKTKVGSGYRGPQEQAKLYAQGRGAPGPIVTNAPPGSSYHNYGAAADLSPTNMSEDKAGSVLGQAISENPDLGLYWGGNFKSINDPLHVQLNASLAQLRGDPNSPNIIPEEANVAQGNAPNVATGQATPTMPTMPGGDRLTSALMNPLVLMGLGLASGRTPQEGFGGALKAIPTAVGYQQQQQMQRALYQQALAGGATPQQAMAFAMNPQAAKTMFPQLEKVTDIMGQQNVVPYSPITGLPTAGAGGAGTAGAAAGGIPNTEPQYDENGKDENFLEAVKKQYGSTIAEDIKGVTEGKMPATGRNIQRLLFLAQRYDQNFRAQDYPTMMQTYKSFAPGGKDAEVVRRMDQATIHADKAWELSDRLGGVNVGGQTGGALNYMFGQGQSAANPQYASDKAEYEKQVSFLVNELMAVSKGSGHTGGITEIRMLQQNALSAASPAERRGAIRGMMDFLQGAMSAMATKKSAGLKKQYAEEGLLSPESLQRYQKIREGAEAPNQPWISSPGATSGRQGPAPQSTAPVRVNTPEEARRLPPGTRIIFRDPRTGQDEQGTVPQ